MAGRLLLDGGNGLAEKTAADLEQPDPGAQANRLAKRSRDGHIPAGTENFGRSRSAMSSRDPKAVVSTLVEQVWNQGNVANLASLVAPAYRIHRDPGDLWEGKTLDLATFEKRLADTRQALPDLRYEVEDILTEGDKVVVRWRYRATHKGDLPRFKATGQSVNVSGLTIYQLEDGKITGHWQEADRFSMMVQLGVIRAPEPSGPKPTTH